MKLSPILSRRSGGQSRAPRSLGMGFSYGARSHCNQKCLSEGPCPTVSRWGGICRLHNQLIGQWLDPSDRWEVKIEKGCGWNEREMDSIGHSKHGALWRNICRTEKDYCGVHNRTVLFWDYWSLSTCTVLCKSFRQVWKKCCKLKMLSKMEVNNSFFSSINKMQWMNRRWI